MWAQRATGAETRRIPDQPLGVLSTVDERNATASLATECVCRWDFVSGILRPNVAGEPNYCAESVMALARRRSLTCPLDDGGRPNVSFASPRGKSGEATQEVAWNFKFESGRPPNVKVALDSLHQHDDTSGHG
jgi:hypothetical protein